jgi:hypothetical protein
LSILKNTRAEAKLGSHLLPTHLLVIAGIFLFLVSSGSAQQKAPNGSFASSSTAHAAETLNPETAASLSGVTLIPASVVGGNSSRLRVVLAQAAPVGGIQVALHSADPAVVVTPPSLTIPKGHTYAGVTLTTVAVTATHSVTLTASYGGTTAGASLTVHPSKAAPFTVKLQPVSLTIDQGSSGTDQAVTTAGAGFNNWLTLSASNPPAGVTVSFTPAVIAAPGSGSSQVDVSVDNTVAPGTYSIKITASDSSITRAATLRLTVGNGSSPGPVGPLAGCIHTMNGHKYQAVEFGMNRAATVDFNGNLYYGPTCNPNQQADEFGYGTPLNLGGFGYIFWFRDFADQMNTSAIWTVGNEKSQCVDYTKAPDCS